MCIFSFFFWLRLFIFTSEILTLHKCIILHYWNKNFSLSLFHQSVTTRAQISYKADCQDLALQYGNTEICFHAHFGSTTTLLHPKTFFIWVWQVYMVEKRQHVYLFMFHRWRAQPLISRIICLDAVCWFEH